MAEHSEGSVGEKMACCQGDLPKMKRLAGVLKTKFTNSTSGAANSISRLQRDWEDLELSARIADKMVAIRRSHEEVL